MARELLSLATWRLWWAAWAQASRDGLCDGLRSAEYKRVTLAWIMAGKPPDMIGFVQGYFDVRPDHVVR